MGQIKVGDQIPDFKVLDAQGNQVFSADLHGAPSIIYFGEDPAAEAEVFNRIFPIIYDNSEGLVIGVELGGGFRD